MSESDGQGVAVCAPCACPNRGRRTQDPWTSSCSSGLDGQGGVECARRLGAGRRRHKRLHAAVSGVCQQAQSERGAYCGKLPPPCSIPVQGLHMLLTQALNTHPAPTTCTQSPAHFLRYMNTAGSAACTHTYALATPGSSLQLGCPFTKCYAFSGHRPYPCCCLPVSPYQDEG